MPSLSEVFRLSADARETAILLAFKVKLDLIWLTFFTTNSTMLQFILTVFVLLLFVIDATVYMLCISWSIPVGLYCYYINKTEWNCIALQIELNLSKLGFN